MAPALIRDYLSSGQLVKVQILFQEQPAWRSAKLKDFRPKNFCFLGKKKLAEESAFLIQDFMLLLKLLLKAAFMRISHSLTPIRPNRKPSDMMVATDRCRRGQPQGCPPGVHGEAGHFDAKRTPSALHRVPRGVLRHSPAEMISVIHFTRQWF